MVNKNKIKGTGWERQFVEQLNAGLKHGVFKRVPGSGAMGTVLSEGLLMSDVTGVVQGLPKKLRVECKVGYGGSKQLTVKKEWLDKVAQEASATYSLPILAAKFSDARSGVKTFVAMDTETFIYLLNLITDMDEQMEAMDDR